MKIRDYRSENRLKDKDGEISQEQNKLIKGWKSEEEYGNIRKPVKEIQHTNNLNSRKRTQMRGNYSRNCSRQISITEGHKMSEQKGLAKWMNTDPHQDTCTGNLKHQKTMRKSYKFQKGREKKNHIHGMRNHKVFRLFTSSTRS